MHLYLVRHAEAVDRTPDTPDALRPLTCRGRDRFRMVASTLKNLGIAPDVIVTSPLVRAVQTAEILASGLDFRGDLLVNPLLAGAFSRSLLRDILQPLKGCLQVAIVGHEPTLGSMAQSLLGITRHCSLKKGVTLCLELDPDNLSQAGTLLWLVRGGGKPTVSPDKALNQLCNDESS